MTKIKEVDVLIVGAGFAGLYMLYLLRNQQQLNTVVLEHASDVGGTWYWNRYPGARCDIASHEYAFSFSDELQQEWSWSEKYAGQAEILRYLEHVAERFKLKPDIQFNTKVQSAVFDEQEKRWAIKTEAGERYSAQYFIPAVGTLSSANIPPIQGQNDFNGDEYITSRWPSNGVDFKGKKVGIIGTGATAIQAIPVIAEECEELYVFQRTANYTSPLCNGEMTKANEREIKANYQQLRDDEQKAFGGMPYKQLRPSALADSPDERETHYQKCWETGGFNVWLGSYEDILVNEDANKTVADFLRSKIRERVNDPKLAELLCPEEEQLFGIKRQPCETNYYEAFNRGNVTLVDIKSEPIKEITAQGLKTTKSSYEFDILIYATGFDAFTGSLFKMGITGRNGITLEEYWADGPRTYLGLSVHGFPNMFTITGPQSPSVLFNMPLAIEMHCDWIAGCIKHMNAQNLLEAEVDLPHEDNWIDHTREVAEMTLFPKAKSWYMGANIPGKPRAFMVYVAGGPAYKQVITDIADDGYKGYNFIK